ncbi:MAG: glycosyl hydrolase [Phycisphaeraceae bacterium]|nr:MAG: glycosyl hydrolase [Phycisphaeraceae bacterium]
MKHAWTFAAVLSCLGLSVAIAADEPDWLGSLSWRCIGPARGGRVQTVTGVVGDRETYYMGACGGGVWKTEDGGEHWHNVSDGSFETGSVGAIAVAPSDPNVVYVGMGETDVRGNFSHGDGVYRSRNAGKTWEHVGLEDTRQIGHIIVDPGNPDRVFVAALGHVFGPNAERGVFRSTDGGETWDKILYVNDRTGAVHLAMDPNNPRVIFASFWRVGRTPWGLDSGGEGSGLWRSTDGGDNWQELTHGGAGGLPGGTLGKIGVSVSAARRDLVYAIIEADEGGVFRSRDGGDSWEKVNSDRSLRQRAWYYTHIYADPVEADTVYVLNVGFEQSTDGGRSFHGVGQPHSDNHDLWIDPLDNTRMINSNDGGANVTYDGGRSWSTQGNQPTAQFYHVTVDNGFPYRVLGAQQDNSTVSISSRAWEFGDWERDLYDVGGCESGYIAVHPSNNNLIYAGCYGGYLSLYDHELERRRDVSVWPENPMGSGADVLKHRFQWTFPIITSFHDAETVYVGGECVFRSRNRGQSWEAISGDLTTNDKTKQRSSGGPITKDNTSVEYYCTVFTIAEGLEKGELWAGSDDGLIHVTSDGGGDDGQTWEDVTPEGMGDWPCISLIEAGRHDADTAYAAVNRYKMDDFNPYIYRTRDRGKTWDLIVEGIPEGAFVRAVREDPWMPGVLYAGTETGVYYSLDAGDSWQSLQRNLPRVPVTDLAFHGDDLVISTQGRSFWILDDLAVIREVGGLAGADAEHRLKADKPHLFKPETCYREHWDSARVHFYLPEGLDKPTTLRFLGPDGDEVRTFSVEMEGIKNEKKKGRGKIEAHPGMNLFEWNYREPDPARIPGAVTWAGRPHGPRVPPGAYRVELTVGDDVLSAPLVINGDPRVETGESDYRAQHELLVEINDALDAADTAVNNIRKVRSQIETAMERAKTADLDGDLKDQAKSIKDAIKEIEETIVQTKSKSGQDPLNYPIRLNDKIGGLAHVVDGDHPPTAQSREVFEYLKAQLDEQLGRLDKVMTEDVRAFNDKVLELRVPAIVLEKAEQQDEDEAGDDGDLDEDEGPWRGGGEGDG